MVEAPQLPRKARKLQAWYICALLHYQGKVDNHDTWAVGLLRRTASATGGLNSWWEFIEGLDYEAAKDLMDNVKPRLVRATPGDLRQVLQGVSNEA